MPSTSSKVSNESKASARESTRPAPEKSTKAQKTAAGAKLKGASSNVSRPKRWAKDAGAAAPESEAIATMTEAAQESRSSRGGLTKTELKAQFGRLSTVMAQIAVLKRTLAKSFVDIGTLLNQIRAERLYEVKGYGSFESFVERELDLNKGVCLKLVRIAECLHRDQALAAGLDRSCAAVAALDGELEASQANRPGGSPAGGVPLHKQ